MSIVHLARPTVILEETLCGEAIEGEITFTDAPSVSTCPPCLRAYHTNRDSAMTPILPPEQSDRSPAFSPEENLPGCAALRNALTEAAEATKAQRDKTVRESVLEEAISITTGEREQEYGTPENNLADIAALWSVVLGVEVLPYQVGLCMVQLKIARAREGRGKRDTYVDMAGYAALAAEVAL